MGVISEPFFGKKHSPSNEMWYQESLKAPEAFWDQLAKDRLEWIKPYDKVMDVDMNSGDIKWFINGVLNVTGKSLVFRFINYIIA